MEEGSSLTTTLICPHFTEISRLISPSITPSLSFYLSLSPSRTYVYIWRRVGVAGRGASREGRSRGHWEVGGAGFWEFCTKMTYNTWEMIYDPCHNYNHSQVYVESFYASAFNDPYITSKLKIFNKNYKGLGTTEKEKRRHRRDDNTAPNPLVF